MRKIISSAIAALMFLGVFQASVSAAGKSGVGLEIKAGTADALPGMTDIPVEIFIPDEPHWGALDLVIEYDPSAIMYKDFELSEEALIQVGTGQLYMMANKNRAAEGRIVYSMIAAGTSGGYEGYCSGGNSLFMTLFFDLSADAEDGLCAIKVSSRKCAVYSGEGNTLSDVPVSCVSGGIKAMSDYCCVYGHKWGDWTLVSSPTCSVTGTEQRICKRSPGHIETRDIPIPAEPGDMDRDGTITVADALAVLRIAAKLAVPAEGDADTGDMDRDGQITVADALAVLRIAAKLAYAEYREDTHDWSGWETVKAATCSAKGCERRICGYDASHIQFRDIPADPDAHEWGEWQLAKEANCTEHGEETRVCRINPAHTETRETELNPEAHNFVQVGYQSPWCNVEGYTVYQCTRCELEKWIYWPMVPHNWIEIGRKNATETEDGYVMYMCLDCYAEKTETLPKTGTEN